MNPLLLTMTFLTVMTLLTSSEALRQVDASIKESAFQSYCALHAESQKLIAAGQFEDLQEEKSPKIGKKEPSLDHPEPTTSYDVKSAPLNFDKARPPNNARINLYLVLEEGSSHPLYEQTAHLMRTLYSGQSFFDTIANAEYKILDVLIQHQEEAKQFFFADELATVSFKDKELQNCFFHMLKGQPPLLHYISFDTRCNGNQKKLNFMFAPPEILEVAIADNTLFKKALAFRNQLWRQIEDQENNRTKLSKEQVKNRTYFKNELANFLNSLDPALAKQFDLTLGQKGGVIFLKDPVTGVIKRERILKRNL